MLYFPNLKTSKGILLITSVVMLCGCASPSSNNDNLSGVKVIATKVAVGKDSVITLNIRNLSDTIDLFLSDFVDTVEVIQLEDKEVAYVNASNTVISDSYIGVAGNTSIPFKFFDRKTGKFISKIGDVGRGPGEYFAIYSAQIEEAHNRIYLLPWMQQAILTYDLQGNPLEPIPTPYNMPKAQLRVDSERETITIGVLPFEGIQAAVWKQDFKGNILSEVPAGQFTLVPDYSNEVEVGNNVELFDISYLTWTGNPDSLYNFVPQENRLKPVFTIDFNFTGKTQSEKFNFSPDEKTPIHNYYDLPKYFMASVSFPKKSRGNSWETSAPVYLMVDKHSLKASYVRFKNDLLGGFKSWPSFKQGYYIYNSEPNRLVETLKKALSENGNTLSKEVKERMQSLIEQINPEGNNVVMIGKMR